MADASNAKARGIAFALVVVLAMLCVTHVGRTIQADNIKEYVFTTIDRSGVNRLIR
jgi:hypothetical protein